jgi:DNA-binding transcriptional MerR regulator/methylmalonyl-CoA mutase cobalamin-binding subunit
MNPNMKQGARHPIKVVAARTGLSAHVIRAWEKRYGAVEPGRTESNRRFYADSDVQRLSLLRQATQLGRSIGHLAGMSTEELAALIDEDRAAGSALPLRARSSRLPPDADLHLRECLAAIHEFDASALESALLHASVALPVNELIGGLLIPTMIKVGESWQRGELRVAEEHMATAVVRTFIGNLIASFRPDANAPRLLVATPAGQRHEFGALAVAAMAAADGWRVTYLGPDLPATEIAHAAVQSSARAVALSVVYPTDDVHLAPQIEHLRRLLSPVTPILMGGMGAEAYRRNLGPSAVTFIPDLPGLRRELRQLAS